MNHDYWLIERWRIILFLFFGLVAGLLTGAWLLCFLMVSISYSTWLLFKLNQLHLWLKNGKNNPLQQSSGIWEHIYYHLARIEKQSNRRKKRMKVIVRRMQGIIKSLPYATLILNEKNEIDWANETAEHLLKINLKKDRGQRVENLLRHPKIIQLLAKNKEGEIHLNAPHNPQIKLAIQIIVVQKKLKLLIARDNTEQVLLQETQKNFIANASHELRTPLTVVSGYLEMMQTAPDFPNNFVPQLQSTVEQTLHMQNIIEDLLTLSRLENGKLDDNNCEIFSIHHIVKELCLNEAHLDKTLHCDYEKTDSDLKIKASKTEIKSLCGNLISNAIRYTPKGTKIYISWQKNKDGLAVLKVKDEGNGISQEHLSQLTKRFYRIDKGRSRETGGTGLGLAIVKNIVERHQATLQMSSDIGVGSVFKVIFPKERLF